MIPNDDVEGEYERIMKEKEEAEAAEAAKEGAEKAPLDINE